MITVSNAALFAEKAVKNTKATAVIDYDETYFVVELIDKSIADDADINSPYVAVNKNTGSVVGFTPMDDPDKFFEAVEDRTVTLDDT